MKDHNVDDIDRVYADIDKALRKAFLDRTIESRQAAEPAFLSNDAKKNRKVINALREELYKADSFAISVAFITKEGLQLFKEVFFELQKRGVQGRILTTDYLCFTDPEALKDIRDHLPNIEVRMYKTASSHGEGFHTKGYLIRQGEVYKLIIGSSNMTASALSTNKEWNTKLVSTRKGQFGAEVLEEFESLWNEATPLGEYLSTYENIYGKQKEREKRQEGLPNQEETLRPNHMQIEFCQRLRKMIEDGNRKGLLISATGTGKTYASAFALRELRARRVLFLAHRTPLLGQAIRSYRRIMPLEATFGILTGDKSIVRNLPSVEEYRPGKEYDFLYSTCEMMAKECQRNSFSREAFDYIVIDEVHRAGSPTYRKIIEHFRPKFLLGMTATPERTEDESMIYRMFDHNIIFEIRLQDAIEYELLCPFHYYGITDLVGIDDHSYDPSRFPSLFSDQRVDFILQKSADYGYSGDRLRGLIFTSCKRDGKELEGQLRRRGFRARFLSGEDDSRTREETIRQLEETDGSRPCLDYIITVDIFNEGVDIPEANQIILLRPTVSTIVFVQQLGRGLRKWKGKDYVVILDFIGNYANNYMIPQAFASSGDKEAARMVVASGYLPGVSTIEFDEIARGRIFDSIRKANFDSLKGYRAEYLHLKNKLNRIPSLVDFLQYTDFDPVRIFLNQATSYPAFLRKINEKSFSDAELGYLETLTRALGKGLRLDEGNVMESLLQRKGFSDVEQELSLSSARRTALLHLFQDSYFPGQRGKFPIVDEDGKLTLEFRRLCQEREFRREVDDLLLFSRMRHERKYGRNYRETGFTLFERYSRDDVSQLLDLPKSHSSTLYGYQFLKESRTFPIFVNYLKEPGISDLIRYEDRFDGPQVFSWNSRHGEREDSKNMEALIHHQERGTKVYLFVRKSTKDRGERALHYFLGEMKVRDHHPFVRSGANYVHFTFELMDEVRQDIFDYLRSDIEGSR